MASLCGRIAASTARKHVLCYSYRFSSKVTMGDPLEHATGLEKRELLAKVAGNDNPFDLKVIKRGPGTRSATK
ncbi:hypothetical protein NQ314_000851 [Rhamnusium bicolor]|uniref:Uncharacterized protein n=1 Tax=Rhamnusium bicolor TaxID=1586634 RepID=A0AAV8ZTE3_9CUCU|nr:hypothetical protein NQ314_000851 [Rhamnusium bicolor]